MNTIPQNPMPRTWCLSGLTCLVLMAGVLLDEGQARNYPASPENSTIQTSRLNRHLQSTESTKNVKIEPLNPYSDQKANNPAIQKEGTDKNPAKKKRMGLAILFLGILAKEG